MISLVFFNVSARATGFLAWALTLFGIYSLAANITSADSAAGSRVSITITTPASFESGSGAVKVIKTISCLKK